MSNLLREATIQMRQHTAGNWTSNNPTPYLGEWCLEKDTGYIKVGDGSTAWTSLGYSLDRVFGSCYGNNINWTQAAVQNTWYNVSDADIADGKLYKVTHDGNGLLTVLEAGKYKIDYSLSVESATQNKHIETGIEITSSGSAEAAGRQHIHLPNIAAVANTEWSVSGVCILELADDATIEVAVRTTDTGTPTIMVDHLNLTVMQIGY